MIIWKVPINFQWDSGNNRKNEKHGVLNTEIEEAFQDPAKVLFPDFRHSSTEQRYILLGKTKKEKILFIVFTLRQGAVRAISARGINKKEVYLYEKAT